MGVVTLWKYQTNSVEKAIVIKSSILLSNNNIDTSAFDDEKMFLRVRSKSFLIA